METFIVDSDDVSVWEQVFSLSICTVDLQCNSFSLTTRTISLSAIAVKAGRSNRGTATR